MPPVRRGSATVAGPESSEVSGSAWAVPAISLGGVTAALGGLVMLLPSAGGSSWPTWAAGYLGLPGCGAWQRPP